MRTYSGKWWSDQNTFGTQPNIIMYNRNVSCFQKNDTKNYNSETLKYTSTLIIDKTKCLNGYTYYPKMQPIIQQYMICTSGVGVIDDAGEPKEEVLDIDKHILLEECEPERRMDQQNASVRMF